jgi:four helix bundle protein
MVPYERFDAWKMAHRLALQVYEAEGSAKRGPRELRRYLDTTLGSLSEVSYLLRFSRDRGILAHPDFKTLDDLREQAGKLTWRLYSSLNQPRIH